MPEIVKVIEELGIIKVQSFSDVSEGDIASSVESVNQIFKETGINKILVITTVFPNCIQTNLGIFVKERMFKVASQSALKVIAPVP